MRDSEKITINDIELINRKLLVEFKKEIDTLCKTNIELFSLRNPIEPCPFTKEQKNEMGDALRGKKKRIGFLKFFASTSIGLWVLNFIYEFIKKKSGGD